MPPRRRPTPTPCALPSWPTVRAYLDVTTSAERLKVARETVGCSTGR
jgi:hypothetical protein